ncbi:MAG: hypothetical protein KAI79_02455 [Bacteroidales bacterium]|nr:hypothetical protein [Bacteroidales bacterium]
MFIVLLNSCFPNKHSYITKSEKVYVKIEHVSEDRDIKLISSIIPGKTDNMSKSRGLAFALPYIFKLSVNDTMRILDKEKAKYIANYNAKVSDDLFYSSTEKDADLNIRNIKIIRTVDYAGLEKDTAFVLTLGIEQSADGYFLRFATKNIDVRYTKAKLKSNDNFVDFNLKLNLKAFWFDGNKQHNSVSPHFP